VLKIQAVAISLLIASSAWATPQEAPSEEAETAEEAPPAVETGEYVSAPAEPAAAEAESGQWQDAERFLPEMAEGGVDACETVAFPLTLLPAVGSIAASLVEWVCLIPAAMAVDYYGLWHAGTESFLWQPLIGLLVAKIWRDVALVVGLTVGGFSAAAYLIVVAGVLGANDALYYFPVGLTGLITLIGGIVIATRWAQKRGSSFLFQASYFGLSKKLDDGEQALAQEKAWYKPPPDPFFRAYALMSAASGAEPERELIFLIPVVGPLFKAPAKATAVDDAMIRIGRDVLREEPQHEDAMRLMSSSMSWTEGALGAGGQALLVTSAGIFVAATLGAAVTYEQNADVGEYALILFGVGSTGVVVAAGGLGLILLREAPRLVRNLTVPLAFGLLPPDQMEHDAE